MNERVAYVVVDLGFGDAGKGRVVDALTRAHGAGLVVRWGGGAQAGHTVVRPDGRAHTFSQLGAGTFVPGVRTLLGPQMIVHPTALAVELRHLDVRGVGDAAERLAVHRDVRLVTPLHQALGRLRELARGPDAHGSCGVGIGEVVAAELAGHRVRRADLDDPPRLARALDGLFTYARAARDALCAGPGAAFLAGDEAAAELALLDDETLPMRWVELARRALRGVASVDDEGARDLAAGPTPLVFEGAQGVLLDEDFGFHPHTTWGRIRSEDAVAWLRELADDATPMRLGVLRTYGVRHGAGPFPSACAALDGLAEPHNPTGRFQGAMRRGRLDVLLGRYALACTDVDALAITHLDALPRVVPHGYVERYLGTPRGDDTQLGWVRDAGGGWAALEPRCLSLEEHALRTASLASARAEVTAYPPEARDEAGFCAFVAERLGRPVAFRSRTPFDPAG